MKKYYVIQGITTKVINGHEITFHPYYVRRNSPIVNNMPNEWTDEIEFAKIFSTRESAERYLTRYTKDDESLHFSVAEVCKYNIKEL